MIWRPLVGVAHGSRDPAAQRVVEQLLARVASLRPGLPVHVAYLQNAQPGLPAVLSELGAAAVIVPLLLAPGYHLDVDIRAAAAATAATVGEPVGPDALLTRVLLERLNQASTPEQTPIVVAAAGSSDPRARVATEQQTQWLRERVSGPVTCGFVAADHPRVAAAVSQLVADTGRKVAVATNLLAPGRFHHQLSQIGASWVAEPLGAHSAVAELVLARYDRALDDRALG